MRYDQLKKKGEVCIICQEEILSNSAKNYRKGICSGCIDGFFLEQRNYFKVKAIEYLGGSCQKCGYNKCLSAFDFHHKSDDKELSPGYLISTFNWERIQKELDKCILLCRNCHYEVHYPQLVDDFKNSHVFSMDKLLLNASPNPRKPSSKELEDMLKESNRYEVAKALNASIHAIDKWRREYGLVKRRISKGRITI